MPPPRRRVPARTRVPAGVGIGGVVVAVAAERLSASAHRGGGSNHATTTHDAASTTTPSTTTPSTTQAPQRDPTRAAPYAGTFLTAESAGSWDSSPPRAESVTVIISPTTQFRHSHGTGHRIPVQGGQRGGRGTRSGQTINATCVVVPPPPGAKPATAELRLSTWSLSSPSHPRPSFRPKARKSATTRVNVSKAATSSSLSTTLMRSGRGPARPFSTGEGSMLSDEQAEPESTATPARSRPMSTGSASMPLDPEADQVGQRSSAAGPTTSTASTVRADAVTSAIR